MLAQEDGASRKMPATLLPRLIVSWHRTPSQFSQFGVTGFAELVLESSLHYPVAERIGDREQAARAVLDHRKSRSAIIKYRVARSAKLALRDHRKSRWALAPST
jgi:hypothetical protein